MFFLFSPLILIIGAFSGLRGGVQKRERTEKIVRKTEQRIAGKDAAIGEAKEWLKVRTKKL